MERFATLSKSVSTPLLPQQRPPTTRTTSSGTAGMHSVEVMRPEILPDLLLYPDVLNSMISWFGPSKEDQLVMRQRVAHVLDFLGATNEQIDHLAEALPLTAFCKLFCGTHSHQPTVVVRRDGPGAVFMIAERIDCEHLVKIANHMAAAGMQACAVGLLGAALKAQSNVLDERLRILSALSDVLKSNPQTRLSAEIADAVGNFARNTDAAKIIPEDKRAVLEAALALSEQHDSSIHLTWYATKIDEEIANLAEGELPPDKLIDLIVGFHNESVQSRESTFAALALEQLYVLSARSPERINDAMDACRTAARSHEYELARRAVGAQLPRIALENGKAVNAEPTKVCDPSLLFGFLKAAVKAPHLMPLDLLLVYVDHGIRQTATPNPFTPTGIRALLTRHLDTNGLQSPKDASKIAGAWLNTLQPAPGRAASKSQPPTGAEVAALLSGLSSLDLDAASRLTDDVAQVLQQFCTPAVAATPEKPAKRAQYPGDAAVLSIRVQQAAARGPLDAVFISAALADPAAADLSIEAQKTLLAAALQLDVETLAGMSKPFTELFLRNAEGANALTRTMDAILLAGQGGSIDDILRALTEGDNGSKADGALAPLLGAALMCCLGQRNLSHEDWRLLAMNLDRTVVPGAGRRAYPGLMEAFCIATKSASGRAGLEGMLRALEPHVLDFNNMIILPIEKRQCSYMAAGAAHAAMYLHDPEATPLPPQGALPVSAYAGLCLYVHDQKNDQKSTMFGRTSEKYLVYTVHLNNLIDTPALNQQFWEITNRHRHGEHGKQVEEYYQVRSNYGLMQWGDPDGWAAWEIQRLVQLAQRMWSEGIVNRQFEFALDDFQQLKTGHASGAVLDAAKGEFT